ncbi:MAG: histone-like protein [bacterium]
MSELPSAPVKRLLTEASGGCRISGSALVAAGTQVDNYIRRLGRAAGQLAAADRRKTIQDADVARAALELNAE